MTSVLPRRWSALATVLVLALLASTVALVAAPPAEAAPGRPPADIVFIIDESGSMSSAQANVRTNVDRIAQELGAYVDPRFALVGYGANSSHGGSPAGRAHVHTHLTADLDEFRSGLSRLVVNGGFEPGVQATTDAMQQVQGFRAGANTCVVLITDEDSDGGDLATAKAALDARSAVWFGIVSPGAGNTPWTYGPGAGSLSDHTGGGVSSIHQFRTDPQPVLQALLDRCASAAALPPGAQNLGNYRGAGLIIDPVNTATGNLVETWTDLDFPDDVFGMDVTRTYNSRDVAIGDLGPGWTGPYATDLTPLPDGTVILLEPDGRRLRLTPAADGTFERAPELFADLVRLPDGSFELRWDRGETWSYDDQGTLTSLRDWTGQEVAVTTDPDGRVTRAESTTGYATTFTYAGERLVGAATDDGREVVYGYDDAGHLASATRPDGAVETYRVDADGRLLEIRDPAGRLVMATSYDDLNRVTSQTDGGGGRFLLDYRADATTVLTDERTGETTTFVHDEAGRLQSVTDAAGLVASWEYDADGNLRSWTDRLGAERTRTYDGAGNVLTDTDALGATTTFTYDSLDRVVRVSLPDGATFAFAYDGSERVASDITGPDGATTTADVVAGLVERVTDADGVTDVYDYDAARNLVAHTDGAGATRTFAYDGAGYRTAETSPSGATTLTEVDPLGRVVAETDATGATTTHTFDPSGLLVETTAADGGVTRNRYDAVGRLVSETDPLGRETTYAYDAAGRLVSETAPGAATTVYTYSVLGRLASVTDPAGVTTAFGHDGTGAVTTITDAAGEVTTLRYDDEGRLVAEIDPLGGETTYTYDTVGRLASFTLADGATTRMAHDGYGRVVTVTDARGASEERSYTPAGRLSVVTDPLGATTTRAYDAAGRVATITDPTGATTTLEYDLDGNLAAETSAEGRRTGYGYDGVGRLVEVTEPSGGITRYGYSPTGHLTDVTDPTGAVRRFAYDLAGQLVGSVDANGGETSYGYDLRGNRVERTGPTGAVERWSFDLADRLVASTDPLGRETTSTFDALGRLRTVTDATGRTETRSYDPRGLVVERSFDDGTSVRYDLDAVGRRTAMHDATGTTTYTHDAAGNLLTVAHPARGTVGYRYDLAGNRVATVNPDGTEVLATFDGAGTLTSVAHPGLGTVAYEHDGDGNLLEESLAGGDGRSYAYDAAGRLERFAQDVDGRTSDVRLGWDPAGRLLTQTTGTQAAAYRYDPAGQLLEVAVTGGQQLGPGGGATAALTGPAGLSVAAGSFAYDAAGNRTSAWSPGLGDRTTTVDDAGQVTSITTDEGTVTVEHDEAGRRTAEIGPDRTRRYAYDARGLLATIEDLDAGGATVSVERRSYDGDGRLVAIETERENVTRRTELTWDAAASVPQLLELHRVVDAPAARSDVDERVTLVNGEGRAGYVRSDGRSGALAIDPLGTAIETAETTDLVAASVYDAFGTPVEAPGGDHTAAYGQLGFRGELATDTGLHLRARDYDPATGRFLTPDPMDGPLATPVETSEYAYALNDPVNLLDPLGLSAISDDWFGRGLQLEDRWMRELLALVGTGVNIADLFHSVAVGLRRRASELGRILRSGTAEMRSKAARLLRAAGRNTRFVTSGLFKALGPVLAGAGFAYDLYDNIANQGQSVGEGVTRAGGSTLFGIGGAALATTYVCGAAAVATLGVGGLICGGAVIGGAVIGGLVGDRVGDVVYNRVVPTVTNTARRVASTARNVVSSGLEKAGRGLDSLVSGIGGLFGG